jgi:HAD superfamily hydrolase (TIGR01509 family)
MLDPRINILMFDLDNTLFDRNAAMRKTMEHWLMESRYGKDEAAIALDEIMQKDNWGYMNRFDFCAWALQNYANGTFKNMTPAAFFQYILNNIVLYINADTAVIALMQKLATKYMLAIATNGSPVAQQAKIERIKLHPYFKQENIYISGNLGVEKPHKQFFEKIIDHLKIKPQQIMMIGDSPENDVESAKSCGLNTCWVSYGRTTVAPNPMADITINKLTDINQWLIL